MLNRRKQFNGIKMALDKVLRNIPSQFPDTFQDEFCDFGFFGFWESRISWKGFDNLK